MASLPRSMHEACAQDFANMDRNVVHSVCSTAASVSDVLMLPDLLHGDEKKVWGDAG